MSQEYGHGNPAVFRARWHDYRSRCIYMVTLNKRRGVQDFGWLVGSSKVPWPQTGSPFIKYTSLGIVVKNALFGLQEIEPRLQMLQYSIMPDHIHVLLFVKERIERSLGQIIAIFKTQVNKAAGIEQVFEEGFNDQILKDSRSLAVLYNYLRGNAYRLAVRREHPEYFRRVENVSLAGVECRLYGNFQLLDNPFKEQVVVHRSDSLEELERKRGLYLYVASNRGVLVSPFIGPPEAAIRKEAENVGGRIILVTNKDMADKYKPVGNDFEKCEQGRLLIVSAMFEGSDRICRETCKRMNAIAAEIAVG